MNIDDFFDNLQTEKSFTIENYQLSPELVDLLSIAASPKFSIYRNGAADPEFYFIDEAGELQILQVLSITQAWRKGIPGEDCGMVRGYLDFNPNIIRTYKFDVKANELTLVNVEELC